MTNNTPIKPMPPVGYSLVEVQMKSGDIIGIAMKVNPAYAGVLPSSLARQGYRSGAHHQDNYRVIRQDHP